MADETKKPGKGERAAKPDRAEKTDRADKGGDQQARPKRPPKGAAAEKQAAPAKPAEPRPPEPKLPARLLVRFESEIMPHLMKELKIENKLRVPRLDKIVLNMALQEARDNVKVLDAAVEELKQITGQKPVITRARKAIS